MQPREEVLADGRVGVSRQERHHVVVAQVASLHHQRQVRRVGPVVGRARGGLVLVRSRDAAKRTYDDSAQQDNEPRNVSAILYTWNVLPMYRGGSVVPCGSTNTASMKWGASWWGVVGVVCRKEGVLGLEFRQLYGKRLPSAHTSIPYPGRREGTFSAKLNPQQRTVRQSDDSKPPWSDRPTSNFATTIASARGRARSPPTRVGPPQ